MALDVVLLTLLHLLVFVYWLGGDLGAFYYSMVLADPARSAEARAAAGHIVMNVDLAPRAALIFAAPTGLALAAAKGWLPQLNSLWVVGAFLAAGAWLAIAVLVHVRHGPAGAPWARADRWIRYAVLIALVAAGGGMAAGLVPGPSFIAIKLLLLAATVTLGLGVRVALAPFTPAFVEMSKTGATPQTDAAISRSLNRVRPMVVLIWVCLIAAAWLGVATPV